MPFNLPYAFGREFATVIASVGIPSEEAFGTPSIVQTSFIVSTGIPSEEAFGTPEIEEVSAILSSSIASEEAFGVPTLLPGPVTIQPPSIGSEEAFGTPSLIFRQIISSDGIASEEAFGVARFAYVIISSGISSAEAFGPFVRISRSTTGDVGYMDITSAPTYRVVVAELNGLELEELPFKNLQMSYILNNPGAVSFTVPLLHEKSAKDLIRTGDREIRVYRRGQRVWGGYLTAIGATTSDASMRLGGNGYWWRLKFRHVDEKRNYEDVDQANIAWDLIDWTQGQPNGDLGFTLHPDSELTSVLRTRKYKPWDRTNIADEIEDMAATNNGFDFELDADKQFRIYSPLRGASSGTVFELGKNIANFSVDEDASQLVNEMSGMGSGSDKARCIAVVSDAASIAQYGLLQSTVDFSNIRSYTNLAERTTEELTLLKFPRLNPQFSTTTEDPEAMEYGVGDFCRVKAKKGWIDFNEEFRIMTKVVQLADDGRESVQIYFGKDTHV